MDCIFCSIVAGDIPSTTVYEDEHVFDFYGYCACESGTYARYTEAALSEYL